MPSLIEKQPEKVKIQDSGKWDFPTDDSIASHSAEYDMSVTAICGANCETFQLAGQTVSNTRNFLGPILNIEPDATALVNGSEAEESYRLQKNNRLEFVKKAGEKGFE